MGERVSRYREQVALALRAIRISSPTSYVWFGTNSQPLARALTAALPRRAAEEYLVAGIQDELYRSFYCQGRPVPFRPDHASPRRPDHGFVDALSAANTGRGGWDAGWCIEEVGDEALVVARNGLRVRVRASECKPVFARRTAGAAVALRRLKEHRAASPGFYTALGDVEQEFADDDIEVRVYFNVTADGAVALIAAATRCLNQAAVPFNLKVFDHPASFGRCDAAVLYLRHGDFDRARRSLRAIVSACAGHLRDATPAFAKPLTVGVALGEHRPSLGASFGTSRCGLVARAILDAKERSWKHLPERLSAVARRFADSGLDLDVPYLLSAASSDRYDL